MTNVKKKDGILSRIGVLLALIVVIIIMSILTKGSFLRFRNIMNVFRQTPMVALLGLGEVSCIFMAFCHAVPYSHEYCETGMSWDSSEGSYDSCLKAVHSHVLDVFPEGES